MKDNQLKIEQVAEFKLTYKQNVDALVLVFSQCGYMTKTYGSQTGEYTVVVYQVINK